MTLRRIVALALALALSSCSGHSRPPPAVIPAGPADGSPAEAWWNGAVFYEVFVRSFKDSDGDGKGDLRGLMEKLDYLNDGDPATDADLGVDALWLMPVFESPSYHGYDVVDYEAIERDYGTSTDLDALLAAAHARGLKVIVDLVVNHTSSQHPWFLDAASSPSAAKRAWYPWSPNDPGWKQPWDPYGSSTTWHPLGSAYYYGVFWSGMPDLDWRTPEVREEMKRIAGAWLSRGVDGFRLDAVRYLVETSGGAGQADTPQTLAVLRELYARVRSVLPGAALVGEAWAETPVIARYYGSTAAVPGGDVLPLLFDFPLAEAILQGVSSGSAAGIAAKLAEVRLTYPRGAADAPFLTNHDQLRAATRLGSAARLRNAAAIYLTLPGSPFLYYGEEVGQQNGPGGADEWKRTPMAWDATPGGGFTIGTPWWPLAPGQETANVAAQTADAGSLLSRYRALIRARRASPALRRGDLVLLTGASGPQPVLAYLLVAPGDTVLVAHNLTDGVATASALPAEGSAAEVVFGETGASAHGANGQWTITLPPRGSGVWRLR
jgi:glycosidase